MARLLFLGRLEDIAGAADMKLALTEPASLAAVLAKLPSSLADALAEPRIKLALNGTLVADRLELIIADVDELAFLPPVSGG
jgi:molybdopterin synthase sulfur carrier subunit